MTSTSLPLWKRLIFFGLRTFIALGLVFICAEIAIHAHPPLLSWGLALAGRSPACPPGEALAGTELRALWNDYGEQIEASSKLLEQDPMGLQHWRTPLGDFWIPDDSAHTLSLLLAQQESNIYSSHRSRAGAGDIVLDCGAHVGVYVRKALESGAEKVVAIEPAPLNLECLRRNFKEEIAAGSVVVYPKGVWDKDDVLPFYEDPLNSAAHSFIIRGTQDLVRDHIELTTIDKLTAELGLKRVDVIKMDIKGAIERALHGGSQTIRRDRPRLILATEEKEDDPLAVARTVDSFGLDYRPACGTCAVSEDLKVEPVVLFFD